MIKNILVLFVVLGFVLFTGRGVASGRGPDLSVSAEKGLNREEDKSQVKDIKLNIFQNIKDKVKDVRNTDNEKDDDEEDSDNKEKDKRLDVRKEFHRKAEEARRDIKKRDSHLELKEVVKERLAKEGLQDKAENLAKRINETNDNKTDAYLRYLDSLEKILDKIFVRVEKFEQEHDVEMNSIRNMKARVLQELDNAREAVLVQKAKVYVVKVDSVDSLGEAMRNTISQLQNDYKALRNKIKTVHEAIKDLFRLLKDETKKLSPVENES